MFDKVISVIVPVYNVDAYLAQCLDSLLSQTYPHLEIVLVDDGSSDASGQICDDYAQRDPRIQVFHKANGGASSARNVALSMITGHYVMYLDSDDWIAEDALERCVAILDRHPEVEILEMGFVDFIDGVLAEYSSYSGVTGDVLLSRPEALRSYSLGDLPSPLAGGKIYVREKINDLRFIEGRQQEDNIYVFDVLTRVDHYYYLNDPLYYYRRNREGSVTHALTFRIQDLFLNISELVDRVSREHPEYIIHANSLMMHRVLDYSFKCYRQGIDVAQFEAMLAPFIESVKSYLILVPTTKKRLFLHMPRLYVRFTAHILPHIRRALRWRPFKGA